MDTRDTQLLANRPKIPNAIITQGMSKEEYFQNDTLRPIAKLQNDLLVLVFKNYITKHKNVYYNLTIEKRLQYIDNALNKNIKFSNSLKGMFIGQFTTEEYQRYTADTSAFNKRIINLTKERLKSNIMRFEISN
ncbi:MAG: glyoxalase [Patiriisocius sp.]|tara:strand:- start:151 stop:552 length:402 start_codon:yes stop_codon:yes gene_type:complete